MHLYLDDERVGPSYTPEGIRPGWHEWVIVRGVGNAKELLKAGMVSDLCLDFNMGYDFQHRDRQPSGLDLCKWMAETGSWPKGTITYHSNSRYGSEAMAEYVAQHRPIGESHD